MKQSDTALAWLLASPAAAVILLVSLVPVAATVWESLHANDLRLPWLGRPFVGAGNFLEAAADPRFRDAVVHTIGFAIVSVPLELLFGLALALVMHAALRARGIVRVAALLPWAIPTVVVALIWRFMFEAAAGSWLVDPIRAWVPVILADVWKTTPFVAILLLAGLQTIDPAVDEAARLDGAGPFTHLATITLPLLAPALLVAGVFRVLDALRVFDLVYVLTSGGPGTATEPLSLYAFTALTQRLRFGYGSALSVTVFLLAFSCALLAVRMLMRQGDEATS
ncbi:MAG: carbohydrate ABC transporter permease [Vicinamibacterales bacterium]